MLVVLAVNKKDSKERLAHAFVTQRILHMLRSLD